MFDNLIDSRKIKIIGLLALSLLGLTHYRTFGQVKLPQLVSSGMVLQRDAKTRIWGWAAAGEKVRVNFKGKNYQATTGANKKWAITLPSLKAGGPYTMNIKGSNQSKVRNMYAI